MGFRPWRHAVPAALLVALTAACGGVQEDGVTAAPEPSWRDHVLPSDYEPESATPETQAAAQLVLEVFSDPSRDAIWAEYHCTDDGDGVVGLTEVDEESVAAVIEFFGPDVFVRQSEQASLT